MTRIKFFVSISISFHIQGGLGEWEDNNNKNDFARLYSYQGDMYIV